MDEFTIAELPNDTDEVWAEVSIAIACEFMVPEDWNETPVIC